MPSTLRGDSCDFSDPATAALGGAGEEDEVAAAEDEDALGEAVAAAAASAAMASSWRFLASLHSVVLCLEVYKSMEKEWIRMENTS